MEITKGKWRLENGVICEGKSYSHFCKTHICDVNMNMGSESIYNAKLIADAGNTYQETNKLPSELAEANKELLSALTRLYDAIDSCVELTPELLHTCMKLIHKNSKNA